MKYFLILEYISNMKKANILIIGMILVILILLLFTKNCKKHEGFYEGSRELDDGIPTAFGTVNDLTGTPLTTLTATTTPLTSTDTSNVLADKTALTNSTYSAFIDTGTVAGNSLKIAKKNTSATTWKVIWSSELSNPLWKGTPVAFVAANNSAPAKITIGTETIGSGGTTANATLTSTGTSAKLTSNGDLVIVKTVDGSDVILWSLVSHEIQSTKTQLNQYLNRGSRIYAATELDLLKKKLTNFNQYITAVAPTDTLQIDDLKKAHAMIVQARHQLDFDLSELNGVANSKVVLSQNGLNSSLYANLMATTLVAGLFILIATR